MTEFYSPKEIATAIGVSESSLKRWVDKGLIIAEKTGGGHRRLQLDAVLKYVREHGKSIVNPELIGLPAGTGVGIENNSEADSQFLKAMLAGDETSASRLVLDLFISGMSVASICDNIITPSFKVVGDMWKCGNLEIYTERRACEICLRVIHELRRAVGNGSADAPLAMGGTVDGDPYTVAVGMAEIVLRDCGWRASSLGNMLPFETLGRAIQNDRPQLMWVSVTAIRDVAHFIANFNILFDTATSMGCALLVGGQGLTAEIRQALRYTTYCDNFRHLEAFARTIRPRERNGSSN